MAGAAAIRVCGSAIWPLNLNRVVGDGISGGAATSCSFWPSRTGTWQSEQGSFTGIASPRGLGLVARTAEQCRALSERPAVQCSASTLTEAPSVSGAEDGSGFCGDEGSILQRPALDGLSEANAGKRYLIHTFGCQMNSADSERMAGVLEGMGYSSTDDLQGADIVVYNTCSIRDKAEQKVYSHLGRVTPRKKSNPDMRIIVAGCVAQQEGEQLLRRVPQVDLVMGPQHSNRLQELLEQVDLGSQICATEPIHIIEDIAKPKRDSAVTAWVNVIYGCNECCTYCVVPGVRGKEQSREAEAIRREMLALGEAGYKEVTLLGQNIDAYGRDLPGLAEDGSGRRRWTFTDLLRYVHDVPGIERIRFTTSHPRYFSERLIKAISELPKVCKFFNIPFQSGDNQILKDMKRGYTIERYRDIIAKVRRYIPDASFSTDIIVGFPGETEEQFQNSVKVVRELGFDTVNTAAYSQRPNTPAADWECQVADLIKADRLHRLNRVVQEEARKRTHRYLGRREKVLVEAVDPKAAGVVIGRTDGNRLTHIEGGTDLIGRVVEVDIVDTFTFSLRGRLVNEVLEQGSLPAVSR